ncbi:hypothetical protein ACRN9C_04775 [Shewanella frigidimarina]|jgi:hypothetical protein|uniref:hypothetical protein n=1 Tax=Shewanella TaxID=22 RepID=UPI00317AA372|tara:strand:+ start:5292 stop:5702 length:411 start_codon:yes stop_codon:yes gene_type:complete
MGLAERRATKEFESNRLGSLKEKIFKDSGFEFEIEVNWSTLEVDGYSHLYDECWPKVYFHPLAKAFKEMCSEDFARDIIKESLKKVVIQNYSDNHRSDKFAEFKNGVLTLNHSPVTNVEQIDDRASNIQKIVEKEL